MRNTLFALVLGFSVIGNAGADKSRGHDNDSMEFEAELLGFNAAGAAIPTTAEGEAEVEVIDDGTAVKFEVEVEGIDNLLMAHIHISKKPVEITDPAGPIAYWFTGGPPPVTNLTERVDDTLAEGYIITDGQLEVWDANDPQAGTVAGLIKAMREGRASVVVHTDDLDPNTPTGFPGDSRAGELRGTLK
ncbi:MAG: CHRD domain-containing protein [Gammaproteobacteria bacterium]|nr:CHRD domain-containing protein [Gammaproteobacteria bacterium]